MDLGWIASTLGARGVSRTERIQTLWAGYGELVRVELDGGPARTVIVKWARPPAAPAGDVSARRKCRSFEVESAFYRTVAPRCDDTCRVASLLAARGGAIDGATDGEWLLVLEDLDAAGFDIRADEATGTQLDDALAWLASFHARFLGERFAELWPVGTYWHLDTRRDELDTIDDGELRAAAPGIAERLGAARYQTLVHGDAKDANFCFARAGAGVAAVDFQYTGGGTGMHDLAYLLYGRADEPADGLDRARIDAYFGHLRRALARRADLAVDVDALEAEWRALYPIARLDFCRFLAGWRPAMWRADVPGQRFVRATLAEVC
jgi:hypothetical protein